MPFIGTQQQRCPVNSLVDSTSASDWLCSGLNTRLTRHAEFNEPQLAPTTTNNTATHVDTVCDVRQPAAYVLRDTVEHSLSYIQDEHKRLQMTDCQLKHP